MSKALATKNVAAVLLGIGMILSVFAFATPAKADVVSDLQTQINALLAQISALQGSSSSTSCSFTFTANLKVGSKGAEVMNLQKFLNNSSDTKVAVSGAGSPGNETSTFGPATKAAVIKFQEKYAADILTPNGLSKGTGNWFASSRAKANALCTSTGGSTGGTTGGGTTPGTLAVTSGSQPANSLAPQGSARVPFTNFTLTNTSNSAVTINGVVVTRTGLASDAVFAGVVLLDQNGLQIGTPRTFDTNHQATIGETMTLQPGQSMTFTVAGNMAANLSAYAGQVAALQVTGVNTTSTVSGSLPISGANQTINASLAVGTAQLNTSSFDPNSAQTKNIGDTAVKFAGIRVTAGSAEDVRLFSIRWRLNGSASASDLSNIMTVINGTTYPTVVSADGRYFTTTVSGGVLMTKGNSIDAYVQGDISGSNSNARVIEFDIDRASDIYIVGQTYGYGITPTSPNVVACSISGTIQANCLDSASTHGAHFGFNTQPFFQGSTITVQGSSVTSIVRATEVPSQNIAINVPGQALGGFVADIKGEALTVQTLTVNISGSATTTTDQVRNITLVNDAGVVVAGPVDAVGNVITFNNSITLASGRHVYTVKGTVPTNTANGGTFTLNTTPSSWTGVTGQQTGNTYSIGTGNFTMNTMTVRGATLAISVSPTPANSTVVAGSQGFEIADLRFDATQSGEDVRFSSVPVTVTGTATSTLTTCQFYNGTTALNTGSNVTNLAAPAGGTVTANITLDNQVIVTKGSVLTLALKCSVNSSQSNNGTYLVGISGSQISGFSASGVTSSNTITSTGAGGAGQTMTVGTSALAVSIDSSSPSTVLVAGGTTGVTLGAYKFRASNDNVSLQRVGLTLTSGNPQDLTSVYIYNGATLVGTAIFTGTHATSSLSVPVTLTKDTDMVLTIKGDIAQIGPSQPGVSGDSVKVDIDTNSTNTQGIGSGSGNTINASGSTAVSGVRMFKSFPVVAQDTVSSTGVADGRLARFHVTADSHGSIGIDQIGWTVTYSNLGSIGNARLYAFTDSGFSQPVTGQASDGQVGITHTIVTTGVATTSTTVTNPVQVSAGQTVYFELRADVVPNTSASVVTKIAGDSVVVTPNTAATIEGTYNFVWTPNTLGTSVKGDSDFVNGANVLGLPSAGFTFARGL